MNFEYNNIEIPEGSFKISPSGISKFFDYPSVWYRDNFLGETSFVGNTGSELGTILHSIADAVANNEPTSREEIQEYLDTIDNPDVNKEEILQAYPDMARVLVNKYLLKNMPDKTEQQTITDLGDGILIGGTYDALNGSTLTDYKTTKSKPREGSIPWGYKTQLLSYAYSLKEESIFIDRIRIVWVVRATKTIPPRVFVVNHQITPQDWQDIEDVLKIMKDTILLSKKQPELNYLLFKSMKLKEK